MLSDIGGLSSILITFIVIILATWNHNSFDNFMVSRLYKILKKNEDIKESDDYFDRSEYIK